MKQAVATNFWPILKYEQQFLRQLRHYNKTNWNVKLNILAKNNVKGAWN